MPLRAHSNMPAVLRAREPWLIAVAIVLVALLAPFLPAHLELGSLLAIAALALLLQGLVRDLHMLATARKQPACDPERPHLHELPCICLESVVGLPVILAGVVLSACTLSRPLSLPSWFWPVTATVIWIAGYSLRNWVLTWRPWGFRRLENHGSILVQWRRH